MTSSVGAYMVSKEVSAGSVGCRENLTYSGKSGDTIQLTYRGSFFGTDIKPVSQELKYDMAQSDVIVYCNFRIKVLEANNEKIRFIVLADDNK